MKNKTFTKLIIYLLVLTFLGGLLPSCAKQEEEKPKPVKYVKDTLCEVSYEYPKTYKEDYRNDSQVSYLLNGNEGIIFILRWGEDVDTDMEDRGKPKKVNDINGYYWKDKQDDTFNFGFSIKDEKGNKIDYFVSADNEEVFWNVVNSLEIN